jgi:threonine/homoserine/homoserine lactone efflux protein
MPDLPSILIAGLTGIISGMLLSIPVGPVNLTVMNEAARRGFPRAALIGLGASSMETCYCAMAFTGIAEFFNRPRVKVGVEIFTFLFLMYLGIKFLRSKTVHASDAAGERLRGMVHPRSGFMTGMVLVLGNPGVLLFWIILAANFMSRDWVGTDWNSKGACILGVALGNSVWFTSLAYACSMGHKKFSDKTLLRMEHGSGICLLLLSLAHGGQIIWQMARGKL